MGKPREQIKVEYEILGLDVNGKEVEVCFQKEYDLEMYEEDIDGMDTMMVNVKIQELEIEHGKLLITEFTIDRGTYDLLQ